MIRKWDELQLRFDWPELEGDADEEWAVSAEEARQISEAARRAWEERGLGGKDFGSGGAEWYRDYVKLRTLGWPWRVATYIAWAASPRNMRWPGTMEELATEVLGLRGSRTIYSWRQRFPAINAVTAMMQAAPLWEHRRDVIEALVEMATTKDYKSFNDRKLFLEMIGDYVPRSQVEVGKAAKDLSELSDEELDAMIGTNPGRPAKATEEADYSDLGEEE